jgi:hypothetical protein
LRSAFPAFLPVVLDPPIRSPQTPADFLPTLVARQIFVSHDRSIPYGKFIA